MIDEHEAPIISRILNLLSDGQPRTPWGIPEQVDPTSDFTSVAGASPEVKDAATIAMRRERVRILTIMEKMVNDLHLLSVVPAEPDNLLAITKQGSAWLRQHPQT